MTVRGWVVIPVSLGLAAASIPVQQAIPEAYGTTLVGNSVGLPDAVHGKVGILVVGFSKSSQGQVAAWGRRLSADFNQSSSVVYFEVPMLAGAPGILRGMIARQMGVDGAGCTAVALSAAYRESSRMASGGTIRPVRRCVCIAARRHGHNLLADPRQCNGR